MRQRAGWLAAPAVGIALVVLLLACGAARAGDMRDPRLDQALELADQGRFADAAPLVGAALDDAADDTARWSAQETIATLAHLEGRDADALPLLSGLVASGEALFGAESPMLVPALRMLAATQGNLGDDAAATRTMLRTLRLTRVAAQAGEGQHGDLLVALSDMARAMLDAGDNMAAATLAADLAIQAYDGGPDGEAAGQEAQMLRALAHLRMGRPVDAASFALPVWRSGDAMAPDALELSAVLDDEFAASAEAEAGPEPDAEAVLNGWIASAADVAAAREARVSATSTGLEPMMAALGRGDAVAADGAARAAFDLVETDDPVAVTAYFALMTGTMNAGRPDLAAAWAFRLAGMPQGYLAGLAWDPGPRMREIADWLLSEGRSREAVAMAETALELAGLRGAAGGVDVQRLLTALGAASRETGDAAKAEDALTRAVALGDGGAHDPDRVRATLQALGDLALFLSDAGRADEAMKVFDRASALLDASPVGAESAAWVYLLGDYAPMLIASGDAARARALGDRAVGAARAEAGPTSRAMALALEQRTRIELGAGDAAAAQGSADQAVAAAAGDPAVTPAERDRLTVLAATARMQAGDTAGGAAMLARLGDTGAGGSVAVAGALAQAAVAEANAGDAAGARAMLAAAIAAVAADSPLQPYLTATDGALALILGDLEGAIADFRRATAALTQPDRRDEPRARDHLPLHVDAALRLAAAAEGTAGGASALNLATEAFQVAQRVNDIAAGAALGRAAARFRTTAPGAATLAREAEDAERAVAGARDAMLARVAEGADVTAERATLDSARARLLDVNDALAGAFPEYRAFADPRPLDLVATMRLLRPDEVLVLYATSDMGGIGGAESGVAMALTSDGYLWAPLPPRARVAAMTAALRCAAALTDARCGSAAKGTRGSFALDDGAADGADDGTNGFDYQAAQDAYAALLSPLEAALKGKTSLIVVPDRTLAAMPFHLMLTAPAGPGTSPRDAPWLIRRMSVAIAPSVASLAALRAGGARGSGASLAFLGVGDPLIGAARSGALPADCGGGRGQMLYAAALDAPSVILARGGSAGATVADLPALPDTRCELTATAAHFGTGARLLLEGDATEAGIKAMSASGDLARYRVLSFATHGLVAGELGASDAGLVLTPPAAPSADDDGILTSEEIAGLRLDADFILLSACNTASGSRGSNESLSGLASAFFLAGARSLLVSHWPVYSDAATRLTTGMFDALAADPGIDRAEALRRSMLAILDDPASDATRLQPAYWGPFVLVGGAG